MRMITVNGNTYNSISAAWRGERSPVPEVTVRWRLKNGWDTTLAFTHEAVEPSHRAGRRQVFGRHGWPLPYRNN